MRISNVLTLFLLICMMMQLSSSAQATNIELKAPADGTTTESLLVEFIFSFDSYPAIENCSLFVDGNFKALRNTMIVMENNKMSATLEAGEHTWKLTCYDSEGNKIDSDERALKIISGGIVKTEYETIYNNNGLRSYLIQIYEGKAPVVLPAMKLSEDIRIKTLLKTHYIDVLRMGSEGMTSFVEIRDRSNSKIHRFLVGESVLLDLDNDKVMDVKVELKNIERNANVYFIVSSYPSGEAATEIQPSEQPEAETPEISSETQIEESEAESSVKPEATNADDQEKAESESANADETEKATEEIGEAGKTTTLLVSAAIILVLILISIMIIKKKPKKASKGKKEKGSAAKVKPESTPKAKTEYKKEEPEMGPSDNDNHVQNDEDFELITSVGKKKR